MANHVQRRVADYHAAMAGGHHGGHDMYVFHMNWHRTNRDPRPPAAPDSNWGRDLVFGSNFLQMHHEMVKARDDEPKQHMMHASVASWFTAQSFPLPANWDPLTPIPADLEYLPDPSVFPDSIAQALADAARQQGTTVEAMLTRRTNDPRFQLPKWATRDGVPDGEEGEPITGARKLADFVNANQLGCCLVFPHNSWHGSIGGAMGSTATAIADPVFYFGVHWHVDAVIDEFKLILAERAIRGFDLHALTTMAQPTPALRRAVAASFTPKQQAALAESVRLSEELRGLPRARLPHAVLVGAAPTSASHVRDVQALMKVAAVDHDKAWLKEALQNAIQLELSTIPPYLCAWWSVKSGVGPVANTLKAIAIDEMKHLGLAANMLNALGGAPVINTKAVVPEYPGPMPGGVHPGLVIRLQGLSKAAIESVFMEIEKPDFAPVVTAFHLGETYATIGAFYGAIEAAINSLTDADFTGGKQITTLVTAVTNKAEALAAIKLIREEGEGTPTNPKSGSKLAHYYRFGEIYHGKKAVLTDTGWKYSGDPIAFPECYPMAPVPAGGYAESLEFDTTFKTMLDQLHQAWSTGLDSHVDAAIETMQDLTAKARVIIQKPLPDGSGLNYGPSFVFVP